MVDFIGSFLCEEESLYTHRHTQLTAHTHARVCAHTHTHTPYLTTLEIETMIGAMDLAS